MQLDDKFIKKCLKENRKAQRKLYDLCFPVLMSVCMRYTQNEEDARSYVSQGFLKIIQNIKSFEQARPFEPWIRRIMINTIIDDFRRNKKYYDHEIRPQENGQFILNSKIVTLNEGEAKLVVEDIYKFIRKLPPQTATVFNLYAIDGYKHWEIGEQLGISEGTSKWHLSEARKKLKQMIANAFKQEHIKL